MARVVLILVVVLLTVKFQSSQSDSSDSSEKSYYLKLTGCHKKENVTFESALDYTADHEDWEYIDELVNENPNLKCFVSCVFEFLGLMDGCSVTYDEKLKEIVKDEFSTTLLTRFETCSSTLVVTDRCDCGYQIDKCMGDLEKWEKNNGK